jgi:hypothetical protein
LRKSVWSIVFSIMVVASSAAFGKTPDKQPPSQETVCSNEKGAAFGLCNAYCEAMDCTDPNQHASDEGCNAVKREFEQLTGRPMPCAVQCPCNDMLALFASISKKTVKVEQCTFAPNVLYVVTNAGDFALISDGPPPLCSANGEAPFVELTDSELLACRVALRKAAEAQGVTCTSIE